MRLELPEGYRHVVDLQADYAITAAHIVEDNRPPLSDHPTAEERYARGRLTRSICGKDIDTRKPADGGLPPFGTLSPKDEDSSHRGLTAWPGTCTTCSSRLALSFGIESSTEYWDPCGRLHQPVESLR